jgi:hypothetical protein
MTVSRWAAQGWRPVAHRPHPVVAARQALDIAAGILTGDPAAGTAILENRPEREQLNGLSDSEVLRKSARQLCIANILACDEFQERGSTALPAAVAAFGEALKSREYPRPRITTAQPPTIRCWTGSEDRSSVEEVILRG